ncbi:ribonuclease Oy-like [Crassostrea virginica]
MPRTISPIILLSVALLFGSGCVSAEPVHFDYFTLAMQWPVTYCKQPYITCRQNLMDFWTIHGLWPTNVNRPNPTCNGSSFDLHSIQPVIEEQMRIQWPNLREHKLDEEFWKLQWKRHGKCTIGVPGIENLGEYFSKTIQLANQFDIKKILALGGITEGTTTDTEKIKKAFGHYYPKIITFPVEIIPGEKKHWLFEIYICLNKNFTVRNCTSNPFKEIYYPSSRPQLGHVFG